MSGLTKLGLALVLVFVFFLLALAAELLYVLWYRRRHPRAAPGADDSELAATMIGGEQAVSPNSKELLLYLLCWKNQSRIEPTSTVVAPVYSIAAVTPGIPHPAEAAASSTKSPPPPPPSPLSSSAAVDAEMAKWRGLYASRVLFTIREEEKEETESDGGSARHVLGHLHVAGDKEVDEQVVKAVVSDVQVAAAAEEKCVMEEEPAFQFTPFSTPCASPPFYTPTPSPPRGLEACPGVEIPPEGDASDDDVFSPAEEKLPAEPNALEGDVQRLGQVSNPLELCTASSGQ